MHIRMSILSATLTITALTLAGLPVVASIYGSAHFSSNRAMSSHSTPRPHLLGTDAEQSARRIVNKRSAL